MYKLKQLQFTRAKIFDTDLQNSQDSLYWYNCVK